MKLKNLFLLFVLTSSLCAKPPNAFQYQAVVRDDQFRLIKGQEVSFRFSILEGNIEGDIIYQETQSDTTNQAGMVNLKIGSGDVVQGKFREISWGENTHFLKVEFDPSAGNNYHHMGTNQLLSVPYALYAEKSGTTNQSVIHLKQKKMF